MLYHWLLSFKEYYRALNVFRYISFRTLVAFFIAAFIVIAYGKVFIRFMRKKAYGQVVRNDGPSNHLSKKGTPTMGGVVIFLGIAVATLVAGNFSAAPIGITLFTGVSFFILGLLDDYKKLFYVSSKGVSAKFKLCWQIITALIVAKLVFHFKVIDTNLYLPFLKNPILDLGTIGYTILIVLMITGFSNAVNLTDGLDGLAMGLVVVASSTLGILAYIAGHFEIAAYLYAPYIENTGELLVLMGALVGAGVGFLWYNAYPAQLFMGDVGSLSLGGILGVVALLTKNEVLFILFGAPFVFEAISVIIQVFYFKLTGRRIFKMAPIHHHFELKGLPETKIIVRFWIVALFLSLLALATLKTR